MKTTNEKPMSAAFEALAQKWEKESRELGLDQNEVPPQEIGLRRAKELKELGQKFENLKNIF